jgi:Na+/H+ antiporter NhaC
MLWFFGDYSNTAIVGTTMREMADEMRMSREKLAYIIDSTAAPVATFGISSWVVYQLSMIREGYSAAGIEAGSNGVPGAFELFISSVPFNMYCILAVAMVGIVVISKRDFGEMLTAEHRSWTEGKLLRDNAVPMQSAEDSLGDVLTDSPKLRFFLVPVGSLIAVVFGGAAYTGLSASEAGADPLTIVGNAAFVDALLWGTFTMVAVALSLGVASGLASLDEAMETVQAGAHAAVLAWRLAGDDVREEFHTPVSAALDEIADTVTEGSPAVYAEIQDAFDGADAVAEAAREIADADPAAFVALYEAARGDREARERHE